MRITECPICGGRLQMTQVSESYFNLGYAEVYRSPSGDFYLNPGGEEDAGMGQVDEQRIYCENDCGEYDIIAELLQQQKIKVMPC